LIRVMWSEIGSIGGAFWTSYWAFEFSKIRKFCRSWVTVKYQRKTLCQINWYTLTMWVLVTAQWNLVSQLLA
jgi:hypothetical protein